MQEFRISCSRDNRCNSSSVGDYHRTESAGCSYTRRWEDPKSTIPAGFEYHRPAVRHCVGLADEAAVAEIWPSDRFAGYRPAAEGHLPSTTKHFTIGAMTTQHELIDHRLGRQAADHPRGRAADRRSAGALHGHGRRQCRQRRSRATTCRASCSASTPHLTLVGPDGEREVKPRDFYEAAYFTAREDDEILTRSRIPVPAAGTAMPMRNKSARSATTPRRPRR